MKTLKEKFCEHKDYTPISEFQKGNDHILVCYCHECENYFYVFGVDTLGEHEPVGLE